MTGFFPEETKVKPLHVLPQCGLCALLNEGCRTKKMPVAGDGRRGIMVVGEAPGQAEDERGRPFVGKTGQVLRRVLAGHGIDLDRDCWSTNALICHPPGNKVGNEARIDYCRPNVFKAIADLKPKVIVLLGGAAVKSVVGRLFRPDPGGAFKWAGWTVPSVDLNAWVCPTFHPSFLLREENPLLDRLFGAHLGKAVSLTRRPWKTPPDYRGAVRVMNDPQEAAAAVQEMTAAGLPAAFDYETNMLKPHHERSFIACASMSNGVRTVVFPFVGEVVPAFVAFLKSKVPKVLYNAKFEMAWSYFVLKTRVKAVTWDGMVQAHVLDNRPGICGLKFQAFVRLGQGDYNSAVSGYLKSPRAGGYAENRVKAANPRELMVYCGMDSLLEFLVYEHQKRETEGKPCFKDSSATTKKAGSTGG